MRFSPGVAGNELYRDAHAPVKERVSDLMSRMTLAEKVGQMMQLPAWDDPVGLLAKYPLGSVLHCEHDRIREAMDAARRTRLGIPILVADDCIHGHSFWPGATIFPSQLGMAATWNVDLVREIGRATAEEVSATGVHWTFSPVLCIARDPRWGRVDETFGEDPTLIGLLGQALCEGYQGGGVGDRDAVLACAKHFVGYSSTVGGRDASETDVSRRSLRAWFEPPFERLAKSGVATFMVGYQGVDGVPMTINRPLLQGLLKEEWSYDGLLVTDWDNTGRMVWEQHVFSNDEDAAAAAITAGNDVIMSTPQFFEAAQDAVRHGKVAVGRIDDAVERILTVKMRLGLFEDPRYPCPARQRQVIACSHHKSINARAAVESLVLLRNSGLLPLGDDLRRVAVVGPNADDADAQLGDWARDSGQGLSFDGHPGDVVTVAEGVRGAAPRGCVVRVETGCGITATAPDPRGTHLPDGQPRPPVTVPAKRDEERFNAAVEAAREADVAIVVVGDNVDLAGEARSTATLELVGPQRELLASVVETGTPTVVVVLSSKPLVLPQAALEADALIQAFNPGLEGGRAVSELLWGRTEPVGRLPISVPRHAGQLPVFYNMVRGNHGDRYADLPFEPAFTFGEGLSYTTFTYDNVELDRDTATVEDEITATVRITNSGDRKLVETVQAYVSWPTAPVTWCVRELKAFRRVVVQPHETLEERIRIPVRDCTVVDAQGDRFTPTGPCMVEIGHSARAEDLVARTFTVVE